MLSRVSYSESSWVVKCFTENHGLKSFLVQGGKKKYASLIQALSPVEFTYNQRHDEQLCKMYELKAYLSIPEIRFDPVKASISFFEAEVLLQVLEDGMIDKHLYAFVEQELEWLNAHTSPPNYLIFWLLELCTLLGFKPFSDTENPGYFDMENGELTEHIKHGTIGVSGAIIGMLYRFMQSDREASLSITTTREARNELLEILLSYLSSHIPRFKKIKCMEVYQSIWGV